MDEKKKRNKFKNSLQSLHLGISPVHILHIAFERLYTVNEISYMLFYYKVPHKLFSNASLSMLIKKKFIYLHHNF